MRANVSHSATAQIETCRVCVQLAHHMPSDHHKAVGLNVLATGRTMIKDEGTELFGKPRSLPGHVSLSSYTITTSALEACPRWVWRMSLIIRARSSPLRHGTGSKYTLGDTSVFVAKYDEYQLLSTTGRLLSSKNDQREKHTQRLNGQIS
jgi:hypothetical protein